MNVAVHPEAEEELRSLPAAERTAMQHAFEKLEIFGDQLPFPHSSRVKGAIHLRELRSRAGRSPWRALYRRIVDTLVIGAIGPEARVDPRGFGARSEPPSCGSPDWKRGGTIIAQTRLRSTAEIRAEQLREDADFRTSWERTALAGAVALAVVGHRVKHNLTQTRLADKLGVRQPQIARLEMGEHNPSLEMLQRLARTLGLRFVEVAPAGEDAPASDLMLPSGVEIVEDVIAGGSRVLVATG